MMNIISDQKWDEINQMMRHMCTHSKDSGLLAEAYKASVFDILHLESMYRSALANQALSNERVAPLSLAYEDSIEYNHDVLASFAVEG